MDDLIRRQDAIDAVCEHGTELERRGIMVLAVANHKQVTVDLLESLPSAQPKTPPYVAEIESEYKKWVSMPHIKKPLAKALYEVWKKHDRGDGEQG